MDEGLVFCGFSLDLGWVIARFGASDVMIVLTTEFIFEHANHPYLQIEF